MNESSKHIVIVGATASGKSDVSLFLAKELNREIISLDSMQVYRLMEVGTGVVPISKRQGIFHHMISSIEPTQKYSVKDFCDDVDGIMNRDTDKRYIFVGGTGLYTHALIDGFTFAPTDEKVRKKIIENFELDEKNPDPTKVKIAYEYLKKEDPKGASKIDPKNVRRIIRSLESLELSQVFSDVGDGIAHYGQPRFDVSMIGLRYSREILRARIHNRVSDMLDSGWIEEVQYLLPSWDNLAEPPKHAIGYQLIADWINQGMKSCQYEELLEKIVNRTAQFSRRQRIWFERDPRISWIDCDNLNQNQINQEILKTISS